MELIIDAATALKIVSFIGISIVCITGIGLLANIVFFCANLKLYTEIMKEKSQRKRGDFSQERP